MKDKIKIYPKYFKEIMEGTKNIRFYKTPTISDNNLNFLISNPLN